MAGARIQRKPSFLWHGILILLPVAVLGIVSLASLRQDEQAAEQDARQRAAESVQSLSRAVRSAADDEIQQFLTLQNVWTMELRSASQPSIAVLPDDKLAADVARWERNYPGLKLAELAAPQCELLPMESNGAARDSSCSGSAKMVPRTDAKAKRALGGSVPCGGDECRRPGDGPGFSSTAACPGKRPWSRGSGVDGRRTANLYGDLSESGISFRGLALYRLLRNPSTMLTEFVGA